MRLRGSCCSARKRLMRSAGMGMGGGCLCGGQGTPRAPASSYLCAASGPVCTGECRPGGAEQLVSPVGPPGAHPNTSPPSAITHLVHLNDGAGRGWFQAQLLPHRCLCPLQQQRWRHCRRIPKALSEPGTSQHHLHGTSSIMSPPGLWIIPVPHNIHPQPLTVSRTEEAPVPLCWGKATES